MLFECCCTSVSDYGSEVWGFEPRDAVTKINLRAARSFLGLPKNATSVGVLAEINWLEPVFRAQIRMVRQFCRVFNMENSRLTKKIISWDKLISEQFGFQTWYKEIKNIFETHNMTAFFERGVDIKYIVDNLKQSMLVKQNVDLKVKCEDKPKLRTFISFKNFGITPPYLLMPISFVQKKFIAKLRLSTLAFLAQNRLCLSCENGFSVENEEHFIFSCSK